MQIILLEKVKNLGDLGAIVRVKDGYARNFLIPNGLARRATGAALKEFEVRRAELEKIAADKLAEAEKVNEKLNGSTLEVRQKAGVDGRLFGSVTNDDISQALGKVGYSIEKARISLPNGLVKTIGEHPVRVSLHTDVVAEITLVVLGETA